MMTCWMPALSCRARATSGRGVERLGVSPEREAISLQRRRVGVPEDVHLTASPSMVRSLTTSLRVDLELRAAQPGVERVVVDAVHQPRRLLGVTSSVTRKLGAFAGLLGVLTLALAAGGVRDGRPSR